MFKELGFIDKYKIGVTTLTRFLLLVSRGYRDVPYHNWSHAFAVSHFSYLLLRTRSVQEKLTDLERLALLVGSFCHDIDHRGTSNKFQSDLNTRLSRMFQSKGSIMERHHLNQTQLILKRQELNILNGLNEEANDIIIATDIAVHLKKTEQINKMISEGFNKDLWEHRYLLKGLCMTAADLSDQAKDFHNSKSIAATIYREFFAQGDLEQHVFKAVPAITMDRERANLPEVQLNFLDGIGIPTYKNLAALIPEVQETYEAICLNRKCWAKLGEILSRDGLIVKDVDYLSDNSLEERALKELEGGCSDS
uniref:3',5'-cyclic-nucleotide phosphodiesterase n=1 Tax=Syphacia muris TaxID=451379 RepID=A0A0N5AZP7_9BILA